MIGNLPRIMLSVFIAMTLSVMASPQLSESEPAQGSEWEIVTVDSDGSGGVSGRYWFTSLSLDSGDNPHISYHDIAKEDLKYARSNGTAWDIETVDSSTSVGNYLSLALDSNDYPHISYFDSLNHDLKYAKWDGSVWSCEIVDSDGEVGASNSIALDLDDNPHIAYSDRTNHSLKYARWDGSVWNIEAVGNTSYVGDDPSLALDSNDNPHISYFDEGDQDLKYAKWDGNTWLIETLDSNGRVGEFSSLVLDDGDYPHISYFDTTEGNAKYAKWTGLAWHIEKIVTPHHDGKWTSLALDRSGRPRISYFDEFDDDLVYTEWNGIGWDIETVDSDGLTGYFTSMALDSNDNPHISYYLRDVGDVKYATKAKLGPDNEPPVADAGPDQTVYVGDIVQFDGSGSFDPDAGWEIMTVNSYGHVGDGPSIATDSKDQPHISYYDADNESIEYAKWTGSAWSIETVDHVGSPAEFSSLAVDSNDRPHISYRDGTNKTLKYAEWTGMNWSIEVVDSSGNVTGGSSLALDSKDQPHISYGLRIGLDSILMYAVWTGTNWSIETVGSGGDIDPLALDGNDKPHITLVNSTSWLKYLNRTGDNWTYVTLDYSWGGLWGGNSIVIDSKDRPHISYALGHPGYTLKYIWWNGSAWQGQKITHVGPGGHNSIDINSRDNPHVSFLYLDGLRYAMWNGTDWVVEAVDTSGYVGLFNSLDIDSSNNSHVSYFDASNNDLKYAKRAGIVSYDWDFGDGSPHGSGIRPTHVYSNPGIFDVTLTVTDKGGATDTDNCIITVLSRNQPPVADANGPYYADEGSPVTLSGNGSYDPNGDTLQYRWDVDDDGIWDTAWSSGPYLVHTWGDDHSGEVAVQVSDGEFTDTDKASITVSNVPPTVELRVLPIHVNASLRIAGEKWHDVSIELYEDDVLMAQGNLTRYPGSPNDQMLDLAYLNVNISRKYSAIVRYTPEDDPINGQPNGANPCWIILRFDDGEEVWLHHTFNVQHPETYIWEVDLMRAILSYGLTFEATAYDPGADDLTFYWDFGDGTNITSFHPNANGTFPVEITEIVTHAFLTSGAFVVTLTVVDDDGGVGIATLKTIIP